MTLTVAVLGSLDTKADETAFLAAAVRDAGGSPLIIDTSASGAPTPSGAADVTADVVAASAGCSLAELGSLDRADAVRAMAAGAAVEVATRVDRGEVGAVLGAGGSNAALVFERAVRDLPFGVPKVVVTTMAVVDARTVIGDSDVTVIYPVVDIDGLNTLTMGVLAQAAAAVVAMGDVRRPVEIEPTIRRRVVAATMFGVTTPCVQQVRRRLEADGDEVIVFHANGTGGRSVEKLGDDGRFDVIVDVTTTELADLVAGGDLSAGGDRLIAVRSPDTPRVVVPGAVDMANFGAPASVPSELSDRLFHVHNDNVTLMRTNVEENRRIGELIADFVASRANSLVVLPLRGVSSLDAEGRPFWDPAADEALFDAIRAGGGDRVIEIDAHINDAVFAAAVVDATARVAPRSAG